jgi:ABC-type glycerol-3-phosphate transport system permease component
MIGKPPRWIPIVGLALSIIWIIPLLGIVVTSVRPEGDTVLGWWRLDHVQFTLDAWVRVWDKYKLADGFWVSLQLAGIATLGSMLLTPAAAYAFQFLNFPFRRTLLIIIINAFVLPQQVVVIPLFTLWRQMGLIDNIASVLVPYVGLSFAWSIFLVKNFLEDFPKELVEASRIDGCGAIASFFYVVLPTAFHRSSRSASCSSCSAGIRFLFRSVPAHRAAVARHLRPDLGYVRCQLGSSRRWRRSSPPACR